MQQLVQQIHAAFPPKQFLGSVTPGCTCDECTDLEMSMRGQSWTTISDDTMEIQYGSLSLLSEEALIAFVPAWLTRALSDLDETDQKFREWSLYKLALYYNSDRDKPIELAMNTERLLRLYETFRLEQVLVVEQWLKFIHEHARISNWDRESISAALNLIGSSLRRTQSLVHSDTASSNQEDGLP